jgi:hypothetical protein
MERNEWAVKHQLDRVELVLQFTGRHVGSCTAIGRSGGKRAPLWVLKEERTTHDNCFSLIDHAHHILLVAEQDRPRKLEQLEEGLCGGQGWQEALDIG